MTNYNVNTPQTKATGVNGNHFTDCSSSGVNSLATWGIATTGLVPERTLTAPNGSSVILR